MLDVMMVIGDKTILSNFATIIDAEADMRVNGRTTSSYGACRMALQLKPAIVFLDAAMSSTQDIPVVCEKIIRDSPAIRVIMLIASEDTDFLFRALRSGASGFILEDSSRQTVLDAIRIVTSGKMYIVPQLAIRMIERLRNDSTQDDIGAFKKLSNRETEVAILLAKGYTNSEISKITFVSVKTIEAHRARIYAKLGITSRAELVDLAIKYHMFLL